IASWIPSRRRFTRRRAARRQPPASSRHKYRRAVQLHPTVSRNSDMTDSTSPTLDPAALKEAVAQHWEDEPCNIRSSTASDRRTFFREVEANRYRMEPNIPGLARFEESKGKEVLEIGV